MTHHTFTNRALRPPYSQMLHGSAFRAFCQTCSWRGSRRQSREVAEAEGRAHERDVAERGLAA